MEKVKIVTCEINVLTATGFIVYHSDNEFIDYSVDQLANFFEAERLYMGNRLHELEGEFQSFNTYNHSAPFTIDGAYIGEFEGAVVNFHIGGDVRGNYSEPYLIEGYDNVVSLLTQDSELYIELSNGEEYTLNCENGEAYFNFDSLDVYYLDFDKELTEKQLTEIEDKMELI